MAKCQLVNTSDEQLSVCTDMLEIGPPGNKLLTLSEQRAHFALWALIKSPLIIGADIRQAHF